MQKLLTLILSVVLCSSVFSKEFKTGPAIYKEALTEYVKNEDTLKCIQMLREINENDTIFPDAINSLSHILLESEDYDSVITLTDNYKDTLNENYFSLQINKALAFIRADKYQEANDYMNVLIKKYPYNYLLYYNLAVNLEKLDRYEDAIDAYSKSIFLNPFYENSHLQLGNLYVNEGKISQAAICYVTYLLISPNSDGSNFVLTYANDIVGKKPEINTKNIRRITSDKSFDEVDLIVGNYAALDKAYKVNSKIPIPLVKQMHAIIEMLTDVESKDTLWSEFYIPLFKTFKGSNFEQFSYRICMSSGNSKHQKVVQKNESKTTDFTKVFANDLIELAGDYIVKNYGIGECSAYYYNDGKLSAAGCFPNNIKEKGWIYFYENGRIMSHGNYLNDKSQGYWTYYYESGNLKQKAKFNDGKLIDSLFTYYENGNLLSLRVFNENQNRDGAALEYLSSGALVDSTLYDDGDITYTKKFYDIGAPYIHFEYGFNEEKNIDGQVYEFNVLGNHIMEVEFKDGKRVGKELQFYISGDTSAIYVYNDEGKLDGDYVSYYINGTVKEKGQYSQGEKVGSWVEYYETGVKKIDANYEKGELTGTYIEYDYDGKPNLEFTYRKGEIIAYKMLDKNGDVIKEAEKSQGKFLYEGYYPNGVLKANGLYLIEGSKTDEWRFYTVYGALDSYENHEDGRFSKDVSFFASGDTSAVTLYNDGVLDGYYYSYYINGNIYKEGWYKNGEKDQEWKTYYIDGTLESTNYYIAGELTGKSYSYSVGGQVSEISYYEEDKLISSEIFNVDGKVVSRINYLNDDKIMDCYANGKLKTKIDMCNSYYHGEFVSYYPNGKVERKGKYYFGQPDGDWKWYDEEGNLTMEGKYLYGNRIGIWNEYYGNGVLEEVTEYLYDSYTRDNINYNKDKSLSSKATYVYGTKEGPQYFYDNKGNLQLVRYYKNGVLDAYSYENENGELIDPIEIEKGTIEINAKYSSGKPSRTIGLTSGKFNGKYIKYYSSGKLWEEDNYYFGYLNGKSVEYWENGNLKQETFYVYDEKEGWEKEYFENGNLKQEINYKAGQPIGKATFYNEGGSVKSEKLFFDGEVYDAKYF